MAPKLIWQGSWGSLRETFRVVLTDAELVVERRRGEDALGASHWVVVPGTCADYIGVALFALASNPVDAVAAVAKIAAKVDGLALP